MEEVFGTTTTRTRSMSRLSVICNPTDLLLVRWSALSGTLPGERYEKTRHWTVTATDVFQRHCESFPKPTHAGNLASTCDAEDQLWLRLLRSTAEETRRSEE